MWVGGGSVANLLALWRLHGVDEAMSDAWERGAVLGGVSAGSICWHVGGTTDSFGPELRLVDNGLAFLPYGNGVHYDSEEQRRPLLHDLVARGRPAAVVRHGRPHRPAVRGHRAGRGGRRRRRRDRDGPAAYRVERIGREVVETRLGPGPV